MLYYFLIESNLNKKSIEESFKGFNLKDTLYLIERFKSCNTNPSVGVVVYKSVIDKSSLNIYIKLNSS